MRENHKNRPTCFVCMIIDCAFLQHQKTEAWWNECRYVNVINVSSLSETRTLFKASRCSDNLSPLSYGGTWKSSNLLAHPWLGNSSLDRLSRQSSLYTYLCKYVPMSQLINRLLVNKLSCFIICYFRTSYAYQCPHPPTIFIINFNRDIDLPWQTTGMWWRVPRYNIILLLRSYFLTLEGEFPCLLSQ